MLYTMSSRFLRSEGEGEKLPEASETPGVYASLSRHFQAFPYKQYYISINVYTSMHVIYISQVTGASIYPGCTTLSTRQANCHLCKTSCVCLQKIIIAGLSDLSKKVRAESPACLQSTGCNNSTRHHGLREGPEHESWSRQREGTPLHSHRGALIPAGAESHVTALLSPWLLLEPPDPCFLNKTALVTQDELGWNQTLVCHWDKLNQRGGQSLFSQHPPKNSRVGSALVDFFHADV